MSSHDSLVFVVLAVISTSTGLGAGGCDSVPAGGAAGVDAASSGGAGAKSQTGAGGQSGQGGQAEQPGMGGQGGVPDEIQTIMATYRNWQPQSAQPIDISVDIFGLCRLPSAAENAFVDSVHGHHALRDWANPTAVAGIAALGVGGFAVGGTIVKEKFVSSGADPTPMLVALGIMIKRDAGFDAASGDWEFVYWNPADGVSRGPTQLASCGACHSGAAATDFVFLDQSWRLPTNH